jgi:hypothetical protein
MGITVKFYFWQGDRISVAWHEMALQEEHPIVNQLLYLLIHVMTHHGSRGEVLHM